MKTADLYIRVSTDEQADKGYSQRDQDERLRKYCEINSINVRRIIYEDHSAKTFNRPQWSIYLSDGYSELYYTTVPKQSTPPIPSHTTPLISV